MTWSSTNLQVKKITKSCLTATRTRFSYRCPWVFNNSKPVKNCNQWECSTWWRTHKKLCSSVIILRYQGGNTWRQIKVEVGLGYYSTEGKCLNLHKKWYLKENMVGTMIAKGQIPDIRWTYTKGIIILREASMIRYTSGPWAWTQSSRSTPTSLMHNLSFTSRLQRTCRVENYLVKHQKGITCENFRVHTVLGKV